MSYPRNAEVKALWCANTDGTARNENHSLHCDHGMLYSYRTMIARWDNQPRDGGGPVCLITTRKYSKTTSAHMPKPGDVAHVAGVRVLQVPDVGLTPDHRANIQVLEHEALALYVKLYLPEESALKQPEAVAQEERISL